MLCSTVLSARNDNYVSDLRLFIVQQWELAAADMYLDTSRRAVLWGACNGLVASHWCTN